MHKSFYKPRSTCGSTCSFAVFTTNFSLSARHPKVFHLTCFPAWVLSGVFLIVYTCIFIVYSLEQWLCLHLCTRTSVLCRKRCWNRKQNIYFEAIGITVYGTVAPYSLLICQISCFLSWYTINIAYRISLKSKHDDISSCLCLR